MALDLMQDNHSLTAISAVCSAAIGYHEAIALTTSRTTLVQRRLKCGNESENEPLASLLKHTVASSLQLLDGLLGAKKLQRISCEPGSTTDKNRISTFPGSESGLGPHGCKDGSI